MVEDGTIERFGSRGQAAGRPAVGVAWPSIAAWMIVGEQDTGAAVLGGVGDDIAQWKRCSAFVAVVMAEVQTAQLTVDVGNPKRFYCRVRFGETVLEEHPGGGETFELQGRFGTLTPHAGNLCLARLRFESKRIRGGTNSIHSG
jgi:hypothetical protein